MCIRDSHAVSPRVLGIWRAVSTSARVTPHASAKRMRRSTCLVPASSSTMFSSRKSRASASGHSPYTVAHQRGNCDTYWSVSYTHLRAHETPEHLVCRLLLEKKKNTNTEEQQH